jgi:DNA-3-methyladenine glycosylase II
MPFHAQEVRSAIQHLRRADPTMNDIIRRVGPFTLKTQPDRFVLLVRSIIGQQISVSAARSIMKRLEEAVAPLRISAETLIRFEPATLRPLGVSPQKAGYLVDLARKSADGDLRLNQLGRMDDESVIEHLVQVKGIGRWTAQMFLIFGLGRLDILPHADLGIQTAIRKNYGLRTNPKPKKIDRLAQPWRPYCSIASWYLWQTLDNNG